MNEYAIYRAQAERVGIARRSINGASTLHRGGGEAAVFTTRWYLVRGGSASRAARPYSFVGRVSWHRRSKVPPVRRAHGSNGHCSLAPRCRPPEIASPLQWYWSWPGWATNGTDPLPRMSHSVTGRYYRRRSECPATALRTSLRLGADIRELAITELIKMTNWEEKVDYMRILAKYFTLLEDREFGEWRC